MQPADFLKEHSGELMRYDRVVTAIAECERIDEVKMVEPFLD